MNQSQSQPPDALPALSALVVTPDTYETVRALMSVLKQQTAARSMEIVLVVPSRGEAGIDERDLQPFQSWQVIELPNVLHGDALAEGVRRAHAPIVALTEDHCFPAPNWAERLIAAHAGNYAVVGPMVRNGNPTSLVSWADFYLAYSKWAEPVKSGTIDLLMGHNASYKRSALLAYDKRLAEMFEAETVMQWDMHAHGEQLWLEASTLIRHTNFERWLPWTNILWHHGRLFGGNRSADWTIGKRACYALASPLIPFVRFMRIRRDMQRATFPIGFRLKIYAVLAYGLLIDGVGQCIGYSLGAGAANVQASDHEFHRERYTKAERLPLHE